MTNDSLWNNARQVIKKTLRALPPELRGRADTIPVLMESHPTPAMIADGIDPDTLGLFIGNTLAEHMTGMGEMPPEIVLFLDNIWKEAEEDLPEYRRQVCVTLLHELGHYLGLEEEDMVIRNLE